MILEGEMNFGKKTKIEKISLANQPCAWTWKKISKNFLKDFDFFWNSQADGLAPTFNTPTFLG
jgi:hypothetical protein